MRITNIPQSFTSLRNKLIIVTSLVLVGGMVGCGTTSDRPRQSEKTSSKDSSKKVSKARQGVIDSIRQADRDIQAEVISNRYRVGVAIQSPGDLYRGNEVASSASETTRQVRVVLREESTKRKLPGSNVRLSFLSGDGTTVSETDLLETWGPYHFYGKNVSIPEDAAKLKVEASEPRIGRHEDMKDLYREPVTAEFNLTRDGKTSVEGPSVSPVEDEKILGSDVELAVDETLAMKASGPYRIGFIVEHAEPYWVFANQGKENGQLTKADIPHSANRHLEIVLLERDSYRIIPHATVNLNVSAKDKNAKATVDLPFLMAAFNHYGNSLYLPKARYSVQATIGAPAIHTLQKEQFPAEHTTRFEWNPDE